MTLYLLQVECYLFIYICYICSQSVIYVFGIYLFFLHLSLCVFSFYLIQQFAIFPHSLALFSSVSFGFVFIFSFLSQFSSMIIILYVMYVIFNENYGQQNIWLQHNFPPKFLIYLIMTLYFLDIFCFRDWILFHPF